jgi:hypothetical protein
MGPERLAGLRGQGAIDGTASMNGQALSRYFPDDRVLDRQIGSPWALAELETGLGLAGTSAQTEYLLFFLLDFLELWGSFLEVQIHKSSNSLAGVKLLELSFKPEFIGLDY